MNPRTAKRWLGSWGLIAAGSVTFAGLAVAPGTPAPVLNVRTLDGGEHLTDYKSAKATVINFWATWCEPCKEEMPALQDLYERRAADGLNVIGVHLLGTQSGEIRAFVEQWGIGYPIRMGDPDAAQAWSVGLLPTSFLIDSRGVVVRRYVGATPEQIAGLVADVEAWLDDGRLGTMIEEEDAPPNVTVP
jgi:thiol-disulfide isomerase/thioredoxin